MIRQETINLNYGNTGKIESVKDFLSRYSKAVNQYINIPWKLKRFSGSFVERNIIDQVEASLGFTAKQSAACNALHIVKSQRKKKKKKKPSFRGRSFNLDSRFVKVEEGRSLLK